MASQEHARSSSSRSVRIEKLERRKNRRPGEEIQVTLSDASSFFVAMRVWEERPFHEGDDLSEEEWRSILRRTDTVRARGIALSLLSRTEHSRFLISQKLRQRELEPEVYEPVLDALEEGGQLSDARFAASWIRSRLHSHPEGRMHLMGGLRSRGVSEAVAQAALEQVLAEEELTMVDVARSLLERLLRRKKLPNDALATRMMRRGFSRQTINRVLSSDYSPYD